MAFWTCDAVASVSTFVIGYAVGAIVTGIFAGGETIKATVGSEKK
jgi:hypothetical protein